MKRASAREEGLAGYILVIEPLAHVCGITSSLMLNCQSKGL